MKKILLIGNGAREHVIAETIKRSRHEVQIFVIGSSKNPGIFDLAENYLINDICDHQGIYDYAMKIRPDFAILGPEAPIASGIADLLMELDVPSIAPYKTVARLESSKSFTRNLLEKYKIIGNPQYKIFNSYSGIEDFLIELGGNFVIKADGLKGGKGVKVSAEHLQNIEEGLQYAKECIDDDGRVVVEEKFIGQEFSLMSFCDGNNLEIMPAVQDHKRAFENDLGPNTGGMGSYSDANHLLPFLREEDIYEAAEISRHVAKALFAETGVLFKGIMYGGFILTAYGVRLIEYNARLGDPEAENVLPLLKTDFIDICEAVILGKLNELNVEFAHQATVCKYLVPQGYPDNPLRNQKIEIGQIPPDVKMYFSSINEKADGLYLEGSRALALVGIADNIYEAEAMVENAVKNIHGPLFHRKDIGTRELIEKRIKMMRILGQSSHHLRT